MKVYERLANLIQAYKTNVERNDTIWIERHGDMIQYMIDNYLPHGSGIDGTNSIDLERSHGEKIVIYTSYHHMDDMGGYSDWTEHVITITPSLVFEINIKVSGRDRNMIKDYLGETFSLALTEELPEKEE